MSEKDLTDDEKEHIYFALGKDMHTCSWCKSIKEKLVSNK